MLEMLKEFEESGVDEDLLGDEDEDEKDDLAERLGGINLGTSQAPSYAYDTETDCFCRFGIHFGYMECLDSRGTG